MASETLRVSLTAAVYPKGENQFRAECLETGTVAHGRTVEQACDELRHELTRYFHTATPPVPDTRPFIAPIELRIGTYDLACLCRHLKEKELLDGAMVAARLPQFSLSKGYVNNLVRALRLHPSIVEDWKNKHPAATTDVLNALATRPPNEQRVSWEARKKNPQKGTPNAARRR